MSDANAVELISSIGVVPVVKLEKREWASPMMEALIEGGMPVAEITLRTDCALDAICEAARQESILVGAGTVLNREQAKAAVDHGAKFIVSPGFDTQTVEFCASQSIPIFPGVSTATEVQRACNMGLGMVKFFPAEAFGGVKTLKSLSGPFHRMRFIPTGGIGPENLSDYLSIPSVLAVGGSWMVKPSLYANGDFQSVMKAARSAVEQVKIIRGSKLDGN